MLWLRQEANERANTLLTANPTIKNALLLNSIVKTITELVFPVAYPDKIKDAIMDCEYFFLIKALYPMLLIKINT